MTKNPHRTLSAAIHRKQPAEKVEDDSGRKVAEHESLKIKEILSHPFHKINCKKFRKRFENCFFEDG